MLDVCTQLAERLLRLNWMLVTAESCTGGMIASRCTDLAGSSAWFDRGFVTYSNAAKMQMLGVHEALIDVHGAVSEPVARAMALGAVYQAQASVSVAVTGIAGPSGGSPKRWHCALTRPSMHQANQTVPTGLSGLPPLGPAMPVTATETEACAWYTAPSAMARSMRP